MLFLVLASGGFRDRGARDQSHLRGPCLKVSGISFNFVLDAGPILDYQKRGTWDHAPWPSKTATGSNLPSVAWLFIWMAIFIAEVFFILSDNLFPSANSQGKLMYLPKMTGRTVYQLLCSNNSILKIFTNILVTKL